MLTQKDICLIIPTYNRPADVDCTLSTLIKNKNIPGQIFVVDQSKTNDTKKAVRGYAKKLPVKYIYSATPSSSIAETIGVFEGKKKGYKLLLISGDDIDFLPGFMQELVKEFNRHPELKGLGGMDIEAGAARHSFSSFFARTFLKLFFLPHTEDHKFRVTGPYGTTASSVIKKPIRDAQWIPGFNNCFRAEVYEEYMFPRIKGYNVLEDIDCSYTIYRRYGKGSLLITPNCKVWHRESKIARYPERKRIFVNHEDHFAFYYRHFHTPIGTLKLILEITGIITGNTFRALAKPNKEAFLNVKNNIDGILCAYHNREHIKRSQFRTFLNDDLSLKDEYRET